MFQNKFLPQTPVDTCENTVQIVPSGPLYIFQWNKNIWGLHLYFLRVETKLRSDSLRPHAHQAPLSTGFPRQKY